MGFKSECLGFQGEGLLMRTSGFIEYFECSADRWVVL